MMRKTTLAILFTIASAVSLLRAQMPPNPPGPEMRVQHRVKFLTTVLTLTPAQQQQATTIFTNAASSESTVHDSLRAARQNLATAVKNNDGAGIDQASAAIGNLTAQLTSIHAKANAAFYQVLTPDQQSKLTQLESEGPGHFFGAGPGPLPHAR